MKVRLTSHDGGRIDDSDTSTSGPFEDAVTLADILYGDAERPVQNFGAADDERDE